MSGEFENLKEFYEVKDKESLKEFVEYGWSCSTMGKFVIKVSNDKALYFNNTGQGGVDVAVRIGDEFLEFENLTYDNPVEFLVTVGLMYHALRNSSTIEEFLKTLNYAYAGRAVKVVWGKEINDELLELLAPWSGFYEVFSETTRVIRELIRKIDEKKTEDTGLEEAVVRLYDSYVDNVWDPGEYYLIRGVGVRNEDYVAEILELAKSIAEDIKEDWTYGDVMGILEAYGAFWVTRALVIDVEL